MNAKTEQKDKRSRVVLGVIILLLFVVNGVLIYQLIEKENKREELAISNEKLEEQKQQLLDEIDEISLQLERATGENARLDSALSAKNAQLEEQLAELKRAVNSKNVTESQLRSLRKEKEVIMAKYEAEIKSLKRQVQMLQDTVGAQRVMIDQQREDYAKLEEVYTVAQEKVKIGSRLKAVDLTASGFKERKRGDRETTRLSRADKVRINFTIDNNDVAEKGTKMVYLKLLSPTKGTMYNEEKGSGKFSLGGEESLYTLKKEVNFQNAKEKVEFVWDKGAGMSEGEYEAFIMVDDHIIGRKSFELK